MNDAFPLRPRLSRLFRLQWEEAQGAYVLLYPEGMVKLNDSAAQVLKRRRKRPWLKLSANTLRRLRRCLMLAGGCQLPRLSAARRSSGRILSDRS